MRTRGTSRVFHRAVGCLTRFDSYGHCVTAYRDDLDAALARNQALARRVKELEHVLEHRPVAAKPEQRAERAPAPSRRERSRSTSSSSSSSPRIVYAAPATYVPCVRACARCVVLLWGLVAKLPSARTVTPPASNVVVLELLRRVFLVVWIPLVLVLKLVWLVLGMLWFVIYVPLVGAGTLLASVVALPVVVLASIRIWRPGAAPPTGVRWGVAVTDEGAGAYAATACFGLAVVGMCVVGAFIAAG